MLSIFKHFAIISHCKETKNSKHILKITPPAC